MPRVLATHFWTANRSGQGFTTNGGKIDKQAPHDNRGSLGS